jgi:hypothetical protein
VTPNDIADRLDVLASRVRRLLPPSASNPHRFHEDISELAHEIAQMAKAVAPGRRSSRISVRMSDERSGRVINDSQVINGRRIQVQRRKPFAIFVR